MLSNVVLAVCGSALLEACLVSVSLLSLSIVSLVAAVSIP